MSIDNMQLKQEDVLNDNVVLTDIFPISNTKSIDDSATGEKLQQTISRIWEAINNKLTRVVNSVNGRTGVVVLTKDDVGLGNVDDVSYDEIKEWVIAELEAYFQNKKLRLYETLDQVQADASTNDKNLAWTPYYCDHKDATDLRSVIGLFTWNPLTASLAWDNYRIINTIGGTDGSVFYRTTGDAENPAGVIGVNIGDGEELLYNDNGLRIDLSKLGSGMYFIDKLYIGDVFNPNNFLLFGNLTDEQITENGAYAELRINGNKINGPYQLDGDPLFLINRNFQVYNQLQRNFIIITNFGYDPGEYTAYEHALMNRQPAVGTILQTPTPLHPDNIFIIDFITIKPWTNGYGIKTIETHTDLTNANFDTQLAVNLGTFGPLGNVSGLQTLSDRFDINNGNDRLLNPPSLNLFAPWGRISNENLLHPESFGIGGLYITSNQLLSVYSTYNFRPVARREFFNQQYHNLYFNPYDGYFNPDARDKHGDPYPLLPDRCQGSRYIDNFSWSRNSTSKDGMSVTDESDIGDTSTRDGHGSSESLLTINLNKMVQHIYADSDTNSHDSTTMPQRMWFLNMSGLREIASDEPSNTLRDPNEDEMRMFGMPDGKDVNNLPLIDGSYLHFQAMSGGLSVNVGRFLEITPYRSPFSETYYEGGKVQVRTSNGLKEEEVVEKYIIHKYDGYLYDGKFYTDSSYTEEITPNKASYYADKTDESVLFNYYMWDGESYYNVRIDDNDWNEMYDKIKSHWYKYYKDLYYRSESQGILDNHDPVPVLPGPTKLTVCPTDWHTEYFRKYMKDFSDGGVRSVHIPHYAYLPVKNWVVTNKTTELVSTTHAYYVNGTFYTYYDPHNLPDHPERNIPLSAIPVWKKDKYYRYDDTSTPPSYVLTTTQPDDWENNYTNYYTKLGDTYSSVVDADKDPSILYVDNYKNDRNENDEYLYDTANHVYVKAEWAYVESAPDWRSDTYYNSNFIDFDTWRSINSDAVLYWKLKTNRMTLDIDNDTLTFDENGKLKVANGGGGGGGGSTPSGNGVKMRFVDDRGYYFDTDNDKTTKPDICIKVGAGLNVVGSGNIPLDYMCSIADHKTALKEVCSAPVFTSYEYWLYHKNFYLPSQGITPVTNYTMTTIILNSYPSFINSRIDSATTRADLLTITNDLNSCITGFEEFIRTNADATVEFQNMEYTYPNLRMYFTGTKSALMKRIKNIQTAIYNLPQTNSDEYIQKLKKWELFAFQFEDYFDIEDHNPDMERGTPVEECLPMVILNGGEESFPLDWLFGYFTQEILCTDFVIISDVCTPNPPNVHVSEPGWSLLNSEPLNWTTEYSNYYVRTKNTSTNKWEYTQAQQTTNAPEWVVDTYYKYDSTASPQYSLTTSKPDNWDNVYSSYYTKTGENTYAQVAGVLGPPKFKLWKFWYVGDPNIPITGEFVLLRYRPDNWATNYNGYYKKTDPTLNLYARVQGVMVIVAPEFEQNTYYEIVLPGYLYEGAFYNDAAHTNAYTPNETSLYHDISTDKYYRWQAEPAPGEFVEIDPPNSQP